MLIPCNIRLISTANDIRSLYAVYEHRDINETVQYVGVTPLVELFALTDAQCNSMWPDIFSKPVTTLDINVVAVTPDEREAYQEMHRLISIHNPTCNRKGYWVDPRKQNVICNETGETWDTAVAASRAHGLSYSQLSNHLNRKPGYKTVKGRTYRRTVQS